MAFTEGLDIEEGIDRRRVEELERRNLAYREVSLRGTAVLKSGPLMILQKMHAAEDMTPVS